MWAIPVLNGNANKDCCCCCSLKYPVPATWNHINSPLQLLFLQTTSRIFALW